MAVARARPLRYTKKFSSSDWLGNSIEVIKSGVPGSGQLGPHYLPETFFFETEVYKQKNAGTFLKEIGISIQQYLDGRVIITKAALAPSFDGVVMIQASRYD